jgi:hypothetical protein
VIEASLDASGLDHAMAKLAVSLESRLKQGLEAMCESIAATAKQTTTFTDRTGALRNSIQSDGVTEQGNTLVGVVSFAAVSEVKLRKKRGNTRRSKGGGYLYGLAQEFGTKTGIREKRFIRDAIDAEDGDLLQGSLRAAFRDAGFSVTG